MGNTRILATGWLVSCLAYGAELRANVEPPPLYDARTVGMGSTGVAHVHNGASLFHNPAALQGVEKGAFTGSFAAFFPQLKAPLTGPETEFKSTRGLYPIFLVGGAYRLSRQFTVGLAVFPTMGFGANYENVPVVGTLKAKLGAIEVAPGASFAITDDLSIGLAYRATYMSFSAEQPNPAGGTAKADLSGWNFVGANIGLFARATKTTRLGLTYRNKVPVKMTGSTEMGPNSFDTDMRFASPHVFKLGIAQALIDEHLLIALDLKLSLYSDSGKSMTTNVTVPGLGTQANTVTLDWKDTLAFNLGAEYRLDKEGPRFRVGYGLGQSATPKNHANPILPPPGIQHSIHAGAGYVVSSLDLDLGGYYVVGSQHASPEGGVPGNYGMNGIVAAVSATYRL